MPTLSIRAFAALVVATGLGLCPVAAPAAPWPLFGGSSGRASFAALESGSPPLSLAWSATTAADQGVWTTPIVTQGARPLVAYGSQRPWWTVGPTSAGNVHLRDLSSGQPIGPAAGVNVDSGNNDNDTFGSGNAASVPFVDTTAPGGAPAQLFVVHNDDASAPGSDVAIAQIDEASGAVVQDIPVPGTPHFAPGGATGSGQNGSDVSGSPALDLDAAGDGSLVFRVGLPVYDSTGTVVGKIENVHVVPVRNARSPAAVIDTAAQRVTPDFQATSRMSPTLVTLADPTNQDRPTTYVAMGTSEPGSVHEVQTFRLSDLAPGPRSDDLSGWGLTVSVPVTVSGLPAGAPGSGVAVAPYLVVATGARGTGRVYRLVQRSGRLAIDASTSVAGYPAPALALDAVVGPGAPSGGHVVLTTENNLYVLRASDLTQIARFSPTSLVKGCATCSSPPPSSQTGFYTTTATIAGNYIYVERDDGTQLVLDIATAQPVAPSSFTQAAGNSGSTFTRGQPAVAGGYAIFAGANGVFAYKMNSSGGGGPPPAAGATLVADTKANAGSPASRYGADTTLRVKSATYRSFMKFDVAGLPGAVTAATLRLKAVTQKSPDGGGVYLVANTLKDGATPWTESNLTWNTMPDLGARKIASAGAVDPAVNGGVVTIALDPSAFAPGNGTYSLALDSASTTSAYFSSKEGTSAPQLLLSTSGTPPPAGSPPVASFTVSPSAPTVDQSVTLTSTSTDPDNDITRHDWIIDGAAAGGPSVSTSFSTAGAHSVTLTVTDGGGRTSSATQTVTVSDVAPPPSGVSVELLSDAQVKSTSASTNYGALSTVRVREGTSSTDTTYHTYLKLKVTGLTGTVSSVKLRLHVDGASGSDSKDSGDVYLVDDTTWGESTITWANRPAITTAAIGTAVAAPLGGTILIDLHDAITADGTYTLALAGHSTDSAIYTSKEGGTPATLVFTTA